MQLYARENQFSLGKGGTGGIYIYVYIYFVLIKFRAFNEKNWAHCKGLGFIQLCFFLLGICL